MSQDNIAIRIILPQSVAENLARLLGVSSQRCYAAKGLDSSLVTATASSPFDEIDDINVGLSNSLLIWSNRRSN